MKHIPKIQVRSYECDSYNHVNNAVYLNYLEHSRMDFLNACQFDYKGLVEKGYSLYVTHIDIFYKGSAFLNDNLEVESYPTQLKNVSGEFSILRLTGLSPVVRSTAAVMISSIP